MISLREVRDDDKQILRNWRNLPEVSLYMYNDHIITPEEHEEWFRTALKDPKRKYWIIVYDNRDVGLVNLYDIDAKNRRCYWAFYLADQATRGKGLGGFVEFRILEHVFKEMKLEKLCCEVLAPNSAVVDLHKGFGFVQEGYFRRHIHKSSGIEDVVALSILAEEWEAKRDEVHKRLSRIEKRLERRHVRD
jgi:UDP-4-amino-4,6-dideoxy-N-acetyl-beta-L-altrosamine N-acetyltransferase